MEIRILHHEGRMVAISKAGTWEKLQGVTPDEFGKAIHDGTIEFLKADVIDYSAVDLAITLAVCMATLGCGIFLYNIVW